MHSIVCRKRLVSPKSAEFPFGGSQGVTYLGKNKYSVNSYVDAKNKFGVEIRITFNGELILNEGSCKFISFQMNE